MAEICTVTRRVAPLPMLFLESLLRPHSMAVSSVRSAALRKSPCRSVVARQKGARVQMATEAAALIQSRPIRSDQVGGPPTPADCAAVPSTLLERKSRSCDAPWIGSLFKLVDQNKKGLFPLLNPLTRLSSGLHVCVKSTAGQEQSRSRAGAAVHVLFLPSRCGSIF